MSRLIPCHTVSMDGCVLIKVSIKRGEFLLDRARYEPTRGRSEAVGQAKPGKRPTGLGREEIPIAGPHVVGRGHTRTST